MRCFKLNYDYINDQDAIYCASYELYGIDRYDVSKGEYINNWDDRITLVFNSNEGNRETDFLKNSLCWLIVSDKVREIFENHEIKGLQYFPIIVRDSLNKKMLTNKYYVINIYNLVDALDFDKSDYSEFEYGENRKFLSVKLHALKQDKLENYEMFRLKEDCIPIFVSEKIVKLVEQNEFTGFEFIETKVSK